MPRRHRLRPLGALALSVLPGTVLLLNVAAWRADLDLRQLPASRRFWEELSIASTQYLEDREPSRFEAASIGSWPGSSFRERMRSFVPRLVERQAIRPWQFWRTLRRDPPFKREPLRHRQLEDAGRSQLVRRGFHALGGISAFLPLWVGPLAALPLLAWVVLEFARSGRLAAGLAFTAAVACSPFVGELLSLYYSAAGFHVLGLVAIVALGAYALLGPAPRPLPLLARAAAFGVAFAVATICRAGVGLGAPVAGALLLVAVARGGGAVPRRAGLALGALALAFAPYLALRPPQHHNVWISLWEGLGDFDRSKGYAFSDGTLREHLIAHAVTELPPHRAIAEMDWDYARESAFLREEILRDVRDDPAWYLGILARRLLATLSQAKLLPRARDGSASFAPATSPNQGAMDVYYRFTTTADWVGLGRWRRELPLPLLWAPLVVWLAWCGWRWPAGAGPLGLLAALAGAALALPVLITTAGAFETQAFVLVYLLGAAFLLDEVVRRPHTLSLPR
jgi:hypothetical protein